MLPRRMAPLTSLHKIDSYDQEPKTHASMSERLWHMIAYDSREFLNLSVCHFPHMHNAETVTQ